MKRILSIIALVFFFGHGCSKVELMSYEGTSSVYFEVKRGDSWVDYKNQPYWDFSSIEFLMLKENSTELKLLVTTTGGARDYDRQINVGIVADSTTAIEGVEFEIDKTITLKAGEVSTYLTLTAHRSERMQEDDVVVCIELLENKHFDLAFKYFEQPKDILSVVQNGFDNTRHTVYINDIVTEPPTWSGTAPDWNNYIERVRLGIYSKEKFEIVRRISGTSLEEWWDTGYMTYGRIEFLIPDVRDYLMQQYKYSIDSVKIEKADGRLMWVDGCPWQSQLGTAWDSSNWPNDF